MPGGRKLRRGARRWPAALVAVGVLAISSGLALGVGPAAAAATKVGVCHATSSDSNPYEFLSVDDDSVKFAGHLGHRSDPNKTWQNAGDFEGVHHAAGQLKPDLIGSFTDGDGVFHAYDGVVTEASCDDVVPPPPVVVASASVVFTDPSCANGNEASFLSSGEHVSFAVSSGSAVPGGDVVVTATADAGAQFAGGALTQDFAHHFGAAVDLDGPPCVVAPPDPVVAAASVVFTDPSCANGNEASFLSSGEHVSFAVSSGSAVPGGDVVVTATADAGAQFAGGALTQDFAHHFGAAVDLDGPPCVVVVPPPPGALPADPVFTEPTCDGPGSVSWADVDGVVYAVDGGLGAGEVVLVDAAALPPATLVDGATTHWEHTFSTPLGCQVVEPPVVQPPVVSVPVIATVSVPTVVEAGLVGRRPAVAARSTSTRADGLVVIGVLLGVVGLVGGLTDRSRARRPAR